MPTSAVRQVAVEYSDWGKGAQFDLNNRAGVGGTGYNCSAMNVYRDGSLGVAPAPRSWDNTGASAVDSQAQLIWQPLSGDYKGQLWLLGGHATNIYTYTFDTSAWATHASASALAIAWSTWRDQSPGQWTSQNSTLDPTWTPRQGGGVQHVLSLDDRILAAEVRVNAAGTATSMGWTESARMANWTEYRGRIYAWKGAGGTHPTRVWYSDIDDYTTQTSALQYFDVGISNNNVYIKGAWALRDSILFCLSSNDWYAYSGVPGASQLRFVGRYIGPPHQAAGAVLGNELFFISPVDSSPCVATPQGVDSTTFKHVRLPGGTSRFPGRVLASPEAGSVQCLSNVAEIPFTSSSFGFGYVEWVNGAWTQGNLQNADGRSLVDAVVIANGAAYAYLFTNPGGTAEIRTREAVANSPSATTSLWSTTWGEVGGSGGTVTLAPFTPEPGNEARIVNVCVDGRYWKNATVGYDTPSIGVFGGTDSGTAWSSMPNATNAPFRRVFRFDSTDFDARPQVLLQSIRSITIDRIVVEYEVRPINHWLGQENGT